MDETQIIQWTIIGSAVAIVLVMIGLGSTGVWVLKTAMNSVRFELKGDIAELKTELKGDIAELKGDIAELKTELKGDIANVRTEIADLRAELKGDMADLRAELKGDMADLRAELKLDFQANRAEILTNRRMLGRFSLHRHGDDGLPMAPLTDTLDPPEGSGGSNGDGNV